MRVGVRLLGVLACVVFVAGCRVDANVAVRVHDDGSGTVALTVRLDRDALERVAPSVDGLAAAFRLDDLAAAGWRSSGWQAGARGSARLTISKPFATPADLPRVIAELNGPDGPIRRVHLARTESWLGVDFATTAEIDLRHPGAGVAGDSGLVGALRARGVDPAALEATLARDASGLRVRYAVELPGGEAGVWTARPPARTGGAVTSSLPNTTRTIALVVAGVLALLAVIVLVLGARRRRRHAPVSHPPLPLDP